MSIDDRRKDILRILRELKRLTIAEIAARFDVSERTIRRDIDKMMAAKILKKVGNKGGYIIIDPEYNPFGNSVTREDFENLKKLIDMAPEGVLKTSANKIYYATVDWI